MLERIQEDQKDIREIIQYNEAYLQKYDDFLDEVSELKRKPLDSVGTMELDARIKSLAMFRKMNGG